MSDRMTKSPIKGARKYLRPFGFVDGVQARDAVEAGAARWLAGGPVAFTSLELITRDGGRGSEFLSVRDAALLEGALGETFNRLISRREPLQLRDGKTLSFERPVIMGILNVTPDSFSDGGRFAAEAEALRHGREMIAAGADILDVGGESTRPGSDPVAPDVEIARVLPAIEALADDIVMSIDTRHAATMAAAAKAGAHILNDVSALGHDPLSLAAARDAGVPVILMHAQGDPKTMQQAPSYEDAMLDVYDYLADRVELVMRETGLPRSQILVDPGVGFGKALEHNLDVLRGLAMLQGIGCAVLLGVSRKSFIGHLTDVQVPRERLPGGLAIGLKGLMSGAQILRVHDVSETVQAVKMWQAV